jgi:hypothetical protein
VTGLQQPADHVGTHPAQTNHSQLHGKLRVHFFFIFANPSINSLDYLKQLNSPTRRK